MVLLHVKRSEQQQFLFETTVDQLVKDALQQIANIHNLRQCIAKLKLEGAELAKHGPAKKPDQQGIDTYAEDAVEKGEHYNMDPTGRRTGNAERTVDTMQKQVERKVCLTAKMLEDKIEEVKGAVMICFPMGLPQWDAMRLILEGGDGGPSSYGTDDLDPDSCTLWFAGKQMTAGNKLSVHVGRHEKTKAVVKLQSKGQGPPSREPMVDKDTQAAMMSWYHKKQEEQKRLDENQDDAFTHSTWASSTSLKAHFSGVQQVKLPH